MATTTRTKTRAQAALSKDRALVYLRLSEGERKSSRTGRNDDAAGRAAQLRDCEIWARAHGVTIVREPFEDIDICGEASDVERPLSDRPQLLNAVAALRTYDAGVLLVQKGDRLARDTMLAPMVRRLVQREGGEVISANGLGNGDTPEALIMRTIDDMLNALELIRIRQRTRAALAIKQLRGERTGGIPYGYRLATDGQHRTMRDPEAKHNPACGGCIHLEPDISEQAVLHDMRGWRSTGVSTSDIVRRLNQNQRACRGRQWHYVTVQRLLAKLTREEASNTVS